jgi:hypothetical protein
MLILLVSVAYAQQPYELYNSNPNSADFNKLSNLQKQFVLQDKFRRGVKFESHEFINLSIIYH